VSIHTLGILLSLALWGVTIGVMVLVLRRARERSREINQQVATIHDHLAMIWQTMNTDQARLQKLEQLAAVEHAKSRVRSSCEQGKLPAQSRDKLLAHLGQLQQDLWSAGESQPKSGAAG